MSDETERAKEINDAVKAADAKKRADAEEAAMSGEKLDKVLACLDALGKRMDAFEDAGKDEEGEIEEKGKPRELAADSQMVRKDGAPDAEEIEHFKAETGGTHKIAADSVLADIQSQADRAATAWGKDAKHPWDGESVVLGALSGQSLRNATAQIFADSIAASAAPESYGETLREVVRRDPVSGQRRIEFYGSPSAWTNQFKGGAMHVKAFRTGGWKQD